MPDVLNLGRVSRRPSPISGLSDALGEGIAAGQRQQRINQEGTITKENLAQRERERKTREVANENALSSKLADQSLRKREQDIQNISKTHERFSLWWNGMDAQQKAVAKTSEQYKELQKFFKSFKGLIPGLVKDNGDIVPSTTKDIYKQKLESNVAKAKMNIASNKGTQEDVRLLRLTEGDKDRMADALDIVSSKLTKEELASDKADRQANRKPNALLQGIKKFFANSKLNIRGQPSPATPNQQALAGPGAVQPQVTQPQQPVMQAPTSNNPNADPLGMF